jgi:uncharacterized damage-inducible protein DinB
LLERTLALNVECLDRDFDMGPGSIRKTLLHLVNSEKFWIQIWTTGESRFEQLPPTTSLADLPYHLSQMSLERDAFIAAQNDETMKDILSVSFGGPPFRVSKIESFIQVCTHGTHHRAQWCNMLRRCGVSLPATDFVDWVRDTDDR